MSRPFFAGVAVTCLVAAAAFGPVRAQAARKLNTLKAKAALRSLGATGAGTQSARIGPQAVAGPYATLIFDGDASLLDAAQDGEFTRGDILVANGTMIDSSGRETGSWEGTIVDSSSATYLVHLTLRFFNLGTLTVSGAAYSDGLRTNAAAVPLVGRTGRVRYGALGNIGLRINDDGDFVVALNGIR